MLKEENFRDTLKSLGFIESEKNIFIKNYRDLACTMSVDFREKTLIFPNEIRGRERNNNFSKPENFVVFECVDRLLSKGYRPEHIELEKEWTLGHTPKGGRADILVYEPDKDEVLLIIECKTAGTEFNKAWKDTQIDGGQLFSYWQQERSTKWLALYASDFSENALTFKCYSINCQDDENLLELSKKDNDAKVYQNAYDVPAKVEAWKETYNNKFYDNLIFGEDNSAYKIGVLPLRKKDLRDFSPEDKIVNRFEEILRHNNVSDKENAFNRLVALFICKLVDEIKKQDDDEVEFQYRQGTDTYESLQDRLQRLHKEGMEDFMKEKIFYIPDTYAENLFQHYTGRRRNAAIDDLKKTIRILKFYSNNDFAFKDVHNEELFYQNGKILVEMVELFQNYRIVYPSKHQFLGDLFEQLLNKGFKQNEGQFFTPTPITRFIWDSLPLKKYIETHSDLPRVIDYACGAGHFLTEAIEAINAARGNEENDWVEKHIFGIEKDYRLARVSKISMFMNGAGNAQIIFGDGLENYREKGIENGSFDILVANPPYSVSSFKSHLKLKNNRFDLFEKISNDGGEIETLFVERIAQLLKPNGIAAVVLPSSILSNGSNSYIAARDKILNNFYLRAIVCFGSQTFGATGTNTVVLFLEKFNEPPVQSRLADDIVEAILSDEISDDWKDKAVFNAYLEKINVPENDYLDFVKQTKSLDELKTNEHFNEYVQAFEKRKEKYAKSLSGNALEVEKLHRFYTFAKKIEAEKLKIFALVYLQKTLIITAPADNKAQKNFLGYEWSNRKGAEGIQINQKGGKLYNDNDRFAAGTLANAICKMFQNEHTDVPAELETFTAYNALQDLIDFSRERFDKQIKTRVENFTIKYKDGIELKKMEEFDKVEIIKGVSYSTEDEVFTETKNVILTADNITLNGEFEINKKVYVSENKHFESKKQLKKNDIFICFSSGSLKHVGKVTLIPEDTNCYAGGFMGILRVKNVVPAKYLFNLLSLEEIRNRIQFEATGANIKNLSNSIAKIKIPAPAFEIQKQIVKECSAFDEKIAVAKTKIDELNSQIEKKLGEISGERKKLKAIAPFRTTRILYSNIDPASYVSTDNILQNCEGVVEYDGKPAIESVIEYKKGDILLSNIRPYLKKICYAKCDGGCSPDVLVFRVSETCMSEYVFYQMKQNLFFEFVMQDIKGMKMPRGKKETIESFEIPVPALSDQKAIIEKVKVLEKQIAELKAEIASVPAAKKSILDKALKG